MTESTDIPGTSAGTPNGLSPSGATSSGTTASDEGRDGGPAEQPTSRQVPGQLPGTAVSPVPSPGDVPGASVPAVSVGEGPSPQDGVHAGDKGPDSDASVASPGSYVALAAPGHPDGEVDTRAR
jgi:hypothetical protein